MNDTELLANIRQRTADLYGIPLDDVLVTEDEFSGLRIAFRLPPTTQLVNVTITKVDEVSEPRPGDAGLQFDQYVRIKVRDGTPDGQWVTGKVKYLAGVEGGFILVDAFDGMAALLAGLS